MCHRKSDRASEFAQTPYRVTLAGKLEAAMPERCPFAEGSVWCDLRVRHERVRKTGPEHPLLVVRCSTHPVRAFTLYPPGYTPYGRVAVTPSSTAGETLLEGDSSKPAWSTTFIKATGDAAAGELWPDHSSATDGRRRRTQGRWIVRASLLFGVHPDVTDRQRESIAARLGVAYMRIASAARGWTEATTWKERGSLLLAVVEQLPATRSLAARILSAGQVMSLWASRRSWEPVGGQWIDAFRPLSPAATMAPT